MDGLLSNLLSGVANKAGSTVGGGLGSYLGGKPGKIAGSYTGNVLQNLLQGQGIGPSLTSGLQNVGTGLLANYLLPNAGPLPSLMAQTAQNLITGRIQIPWSSIYGGQSDWTNPYSGYVESIGNIIPGLGTVLGGFLESIIGKGQPGPKDDPKFVSAYSSGEKRLKELKDKGMSAYDIYKWAEPQGYVLQGNALDKLYYGNQKAGSDISRVFTPQEAMTVNTFLDPRWGEHYGNIPMQSSEGWYFPNVGETTEAYTGQKIRTGSELYKSLDDLLKAYPMTKTMSFGVSTNRNDPYWDMYLEGNPNRVYKNDEIPGGLYQG